MSGAARSGNRLRTAARLLAEDVLDVAGGEDGRDVVVRPGFVEHSANLFDGATGIESHEAERGLLTEYGDEHGILADGDHEELRVLALLVQCGELLFADA